MPSIRDVKASQEVLPAMSAMQREKTRMRCHSICTLAESRTVECLLWNRRLKPTSVVETRTGTGRSGVETGADVTIHPPRGFSITLGKIPRLSLGHGISLTPINHAGEHENNHNSNSSGITLYVLCRSFCRPAHSGYRYISILHVSVYMGIYGPTVTCAPLQPRELLSNLSNLVQPLPF